MHLWLAMPTMLHQICALHNVKQDILIVEVIQAWIWRKAGLTRAVSTHAVHAIQGGRLVQADRQVAAYFTEGSQEFLQRSSVGIHAVMVQRGSSSLCAASTASRCDAV